MLSQIGDGVIKINQAVPGFFDAESLRDLTGITPSEFAGDTVDDSVLLEGITL